MSRPENLKIIGCKQGLIRGTKVKYRASGTKKPVYDTVLAHLQCAWKCYKNLENVRIIFLGHQHVI